MNKKTWPFPIMLESSSFREENFSNLGLDIYQHSSSTQTGIHPRGWTYLTAVYSEIPALALCNLMSNLLALIISASSLKNASFSFLASTDSNPEPNPPLRPWSSPLGLLLAPRIISNLPPSGIGRGWSKFGGSRLGPIPAFHGRKVFFAVVSAMVARMPVMI